MKMLIIGATSPTGQQLVQQALEPGHEVIALARNPASLEERDRFKVATGDVLNPRFARSSHTQSTSHNQRPGHKLTLKPTTLLSEGTKNLIGAMEKQGVRGLICITGIGSGDSQGHGGFVYDKLILPFLLKNIYQDKTDKNRSSARAIWIGSLFVQHY